MAEVDGALLLELAANATAPSTVVALAGWLVRLDDDLPFRRSNCVLPWGDPPRPLDDTIATVEATYAEHGRPARFQVDARARPTGLDDLLAARGYTVEAPVDILVAPAAALAVEGAPTTPTVVRQHLDESWASRFTAVHGAAVEPDRLRAYGRQLDRSAATTLVATASRDGAPAGVAFAIGERGWLGVFGMVVAPAERRQGVARALLTGLALAGEERGCDHLYLQVEAANTAARTLYRSAGFERVTGYHYRRHPPAAS